jgi:hypothetical protein
MNTTKTVFSMALLSAGAAAVLALAGCGGSGSAHHTPDGGGHRPATHTSSTPAPSTSSTDDDGGSRGRAAEQGRDPARVALDGFKVHRWTEHDDDGTDTPWLQVHVTATNHTGVTHTYYYGFGVYRKSDNVRVATLECDVDNVGPGVTAQSEPSDCAMNDFAPVWPISVTEATLRLDSAAVN